ncbi:MAG: hypothetical protein M3Q05_11855 [Bacteroidota bacterium]|nr:hypothetical protein [Bacteroidota bacterium]
MHKTEQINFSDIEDSRLPLGFKKIHQEKIPALTVENKLMLYNTKYHFSTKQVAAANKPISKILK